MTKNCMMDLHNHTTWSDGVNSPSEIIENAIRNNISIVGITDHLQIQNCPSVSFSEIDSYIDELIDMKSFYCNSIKVLIGIEVYPFPYPKFLENFPFQKLGGLDYILLENLESMSPSITFTDIENHLQRFKCRIGLAHTNLIKLGNTHGGLKNVLEFLARNNIFWEINSNSIYDFYDDIIYESKNTAIQSLIKCIKDYKIDVSVGSDTHDLDDYEFGRLYEANKIIKTLNRILL